MPTLNATEARLQKSVTGHRNRCTLPPSVPTDGYHIATESPAEQEFGQRTGPDTYFEFENGVQRPGRADHVAHDGDPHAHGEIVETLDGRYLGYDQRRVPDGDAKMSGAGRQTAVRRRLAAGRPEKRAVRNGQRNEKK